MLLTGIDHVHARADFGGVELDHVVAETLHRGDDLTLQEEESHDVGGTAIELRSDVFRGRAALDDDLAVGDGQAARLPRRHLGRLELFDVAAATSRGLALRSARTARCRDWVVHRGSDHPERRSRRCTGTLAREIHPRRRRDVTSVHRGATRDSVEGSSAAGHRGPTDVRRARTSDGARRAAAGSVDRWNSSVDRAAAGSGGRSN